MIQLLHILRFLSDTPQLGATLPASFQCWAGCERRGLVLMEGEAFGLST